MRKSSAYLLALICWLGFSTAGAQDNPVKRALLIGIDEYASPELNDLSGAVNDARLLESVLLGKFAIPPENIATLYNEQATRAGIIEAIQTHLIDADPPADIAIIHYSGHGSQMPDQSNDEIDGWDETLVPHDSRIGNTFDISDDEVNGLLRELAIKTPNITLIMDSCHSGSLARAGQLGAIARQVPRDQRTPPALADFALGTATESANDFHLPEANYVLISGSQAHQLSHEALLGEQHHGALSYHLAQALQSAGTNTTYRDLMETVQANVEALFPSQRPDLEGTLLDTIVFGDRQILPQPFVLVEPAEQPGAVIIQAGRLLGLSADDVLDVYPPATKRFDGSTPAIAKIRLTEVQNFTADAFIENSGTVPTHSRAVIQQVSPPDFAIGLYIEQTDAEVLRQIESALVQHESIRIDTERNLAELRLSVSNQNVLLTNREARVLAIAPINNSQQMVDRIAHWGRWYGVLAIHNTNPSVDVDLAIRLPDTPPSSPPPAAITSGSKLAIEVTNTSEMDLHIIVLDLASDGSICVLYPSSGNCRIREQSDVLLAGKTLTLPPISSNIPAGKQESVDIVKVIASSEKISPHIFALAPVARNAAPAPRAGESALERYIRQSTQGLTRNLSTTAVAGWVTRHTTLRVVQQNMQTTGIALHFADTAQAEAAPQRLPDSRAVCGTQVNNTCLQMNPMRGDPTIVEVSAPITRGARSRTGSVAAAFDEAYKLRDETGAERAEPLFEMELPQIQAEPQGTRGSGGEEHDERAQQDPFWSHNYVYAPQAWEMLRANGQVEGQEAAGVIIGHPDTGYTEHPEIWPDDPAQRPILADQGYNYHDDNHDPKDDLQNSRRLDNPAHGTGSSSAIISPTDCQLSNAEKCPTGIARGAHLVPLRINRSVVQFSTKKMAQAILDAADTDRSRIKTKPDFLSIAMGGVPSWTLWKAVKTAEEKGLLIIAAAGNYVRTVVWPARYESVIAVAAVNAGCKPWQHTSNGRSVDFSAPGESVWRATISDSDPPQFITGMGIGTTYATATTSGVAALWLAHHADNPELERLKQTGQLTARFRELVRQTAWRPGTVTAPTSCDPDADWQAKRMGAGVINAQALLEQPLQVSNQRTAAAASIEQLPLWSSLYGSDTAPERRVNDYRQLFANAPLEEIAFFEAEITHYYATNERIRAALDAIVNAENPTATLFNTASQTLLEHIISGRLRAALEN